MPSPFVSSLPTGIFSHVNFPMAEAGGVEAKRALAGARHKALNFDDLPTAYEQALTLPPLVSKQRPLYMRQQPTVDRKLLQYCLDNMGARQFRCFQLTMQATASRKQAAFVEDDDLDAGFDFLAKHGPQKPFGKECLDGSVQAEQPELDFLCGELGLSPLATFWITRRRSGADVDAILKRACFILNTKKFVYYRPSGVNEDKVARRFVEGPDFLTQTGKMLYGKYKDSCKTLPENFEEEVRKEKAWLELVFKQKQEKQDPKYKQNRQLRQLFRGSEESKSCLEKMETKVKVKREIQEARTNEALKKAKVWSTELTASRTFIVLDDEDDTQADMEQDNFAGSWTERFKWKRSLTQLLTASMPKHRCSQWKCLVYINPQHLQPLFVDGRGAAAQPLQTQAALLMLKLNNNPVAQRLLHVNHTMIKDLDKRLCHARKTWVEAKEKDIVFGKNQKWADVKADKTTFDRMDLGNTAPDPNNPVVWEQWCGIVQRGHPETLVLHRLSPKESAKRAPGRGAIRKVERSPLAKKRLQDKKVILRTDSAKSYKTKVPGVLHDKVVHAKKRVKVKGQWKWKAPTYVKLVKHKNPITKKMMTVKSGTRVVDFIKSLQKSCIRRFDDVGSEASLWYACSAKRSAMAATVFSPPIGSEVQVS
ncbi:unnamed protein product [Effrenium voratum]|uniref:Uncharacterized protein n=1 Tax=Effrenium voratum TaxID=2562239 RepID=A0AA36HVM0_9DINO|nr:unnamed protein product [Effrenium voratum]